jgi:hypothetical protein
LSNERAGLILHDRERPPAQPALQMLDAADFDLLRPHLVTIEWPGSLS